MPEIETPPAPALDAPRPAGPIVLDEQRQGEALPDYHTRVLRFALRFGIDSLTGEQLSIADARAQAAVCTLPAKLDQDAGRLDARLHTLRIRIQNALEARRRRLRDLERQLATLDQDAAQEAAQAQETASQDQDDPQARALRLLRAALILVMQGPGPSNGPGGSLAPLQPPGPDKGPGSHADTRTPPAPGRRF